MTIDETKKIIDKIKVYRPKFEITQNVLEEYFKIFEKYDYEDVENKLNDYLADITNKNSYPDPIYLTKFIKTTYEKEHMSEPNIMCSYCSKSIKHLEYKAHVNRCSSIQWIYECAKHYFLVNLDKKKLFAMSEKEFDKFYYDFSKKLYPKLPDGTAQKKALDNVIKSYEGVPVGYTLEEINAALDD